MYIGALRNRYCMYIVFTLINNVIYSTCPLQLTTCMLPRRACSFQFREYSLTQEEKTLEIDKAGDITIEHNLYYNKFLCLYKNITVSYISDLCPLIHCLPYFSKQLHFVNKTAYYFIDISISFRRNLFKTIVWYCSHTKILP